jgi:FkbM family methyltransferase
MLRTYLKNHPRLFDVAKAASRLGGNRTRLYEFLHRVLPPTEAVTFLQAGANDGLTLDPYREFILRPNFRGVLVEPAPYPFKQLQAGYRHKTGLQYDDCLISYPPGETVDFFTLAEGFLAGRPDASQLSMLSSLSREQLSQALSGQEDCRPHIVRTQVTGRTVEQLMFKHGYTGFDCLFIDIEGYEPHVLLAMDYAVVRPKLIAFESLHLGSARDEVRAHLGRKGFQLFEFDQEMIAVGTAWSKRARS